MARGVTAPRRAALEVLAQLRGGELADRALSRSATALPPRDHAWAQELIYGTLRLRGRIDHLLSAFVRAGLDSLDPVVLDILRLGTYQLLEMGGVPSYAAVSQSVELARAAGAPRAAGLVNGVLQAVRRGAAEVAFPTLEEDPVGHLSSWGSHPRWLVERWVARWGAEDAARLVEANNRRPKLYLRPVGLTAGEALARLRRAGIEAVETSGFPGSIRVLAPHGPREALAAVPAVVQDPAAAAVVRFADVPAGSLVLDVCAAPGGKSVALAERAGFVVAGDLSAGRLRRLRSNVERVGLSGKVALVVADARRPAYRAADAVLIDAPCTGTGTLRRHPDGRWRITEGDLRALARLQAELLAAAAPLVRPGGLLVYATCSLESEENEERVAVFLADHPEFRSEAPEMPFGGTMLCESFLCVLPQRHGVDGAFAARMRRTE